MSSVRTAMAMSLWLGALLCAGCADAGDGTGLATLPAWTAERDLRVGSVGDSATVLTWFRAMEVGPGGLMYTVHPQEQVVRVFDADGAVVRLVGGRGEGPGEFQNVGTLGWVADTLWVLDFSGYRFSQFDADGDYLGSFSVPFVAGPDPTQRQPPRAYGLLFDGTVHGAPPAFSHLIDAGVITHDVPMLMTRDGQVTDSLLPVPYGRNLWAISDPDAPNRGGTYMSQPYADGPQWGFVPGERALVVLDREAPTQAEGAAFRLTKVDFAGDTLFSRTYPYEAIPLPEAEVDSILDTTVAWISGSRFMGGLAEGTARAWAARGLYRPPFRPPIAAMVLARNGEIWLQEPSSGDQAPWLVLSRTGEPTARVSLPSSVNVLVTDGAHVWGSENDEFEVPYLVRFRVARGGT